MTGIIVQKDTMPLNGGEKFTQYAVVFQEKIHHTLKYSLLYEGYRTEWSTKDDADKWIELTKDYVL